MAIMAFVGSNLDARSAGVFSGMYQLNPTQGSAFNYTNQNMLNAHPMMRWRALGNTRTAFRKDFTAQGDKKIPIPVKATPIIIETIVGDITDKKQTVLVQAFPRSQF